MRIRSAFFLIVLVPFLFTSCSTEIDFADDWKENTILYGLLNPKDSHHVIKIGRSFLDASTNAYKTSNNIDSLYYNEIEVKLYAFQNNELKDSFLFNEVMLNDKDSGTFHFPDYKAYEMSSYLNANYQYKLEISTPLGNKVTSTTDLIGTDYNVIRPSALSKVNFTIDNAHRVMFTLPDNTYDFYVEFELFYTEEKGGNDTAKSIRLSLFNEVNTDYNYGETVEIEYPGKSLYNTLKNKIPVDNNVRRTADSAQYHFYFKGEHLSNYIRAGNAQSGLSQTQVVLDYSNIKNGYGILSSVYNHTVYSKNLADIFKDSLACGYITKDLNFLDRNGLLGCP
jgi:hypothetical protein